MQLADVTLREGNQMPGRSYTAEQRLEAGKALDDLGVAFVQAGFPVVGEEDTEAVRQLTGAIDAEVIALARAIDSDVDAALDAEPDVVEVIAPISNLQLDHVLDTSREAVLEMLADAADRVRDGGATPHVTLVDAFRSEPEHVVTAFERLDVSRITVADSVGARTPDQVGDFLDTVGESADLSRASAHFHDDLGVATANVLRAYQAGVGTTDVSVASLGERAGNASLEQVVVAAAAQGLDVAVEQGALVPTCERVLDALDETVDPRAPVLGEEVTSHESGLHTAAMLEEPATFEPYDPAQFGGERTLLFGAGTGRGAARILIERAGGEPNPETVGEFLDALAAEGPMDGGEALALAERVVGE